MDDILVKCAAFIMNGALVCAPVGGHSDRSTLTSVRSRSTAMLSISSPRALERYKSPRREYLR